MTVQQQSDNASAIAGTGRVSRPGKSGDSQNWRLIVMGRPSKYNEVLRERAARMVAEIRPDYGSQWAAICAVAASGAVALLDP
jgi:hypothetical protein